MIAMLRGEVVSHHGEWLVLDVNGVGYQVFVSPEAPRSGAALLHISTVVREDAFLLYGFMSVSGRDAFNTLRAVSGIGTRLAIAVLSHLPLDELSRAVSADDLRTLSKVPGVGKKTAQRMCLELKAKLPAQFTVDAGDAAVGVSAPLPLMPRDPLPLALAQLGYRKSEIDAVLAHPDVPGIDTPVGQRLSAALRVLARPL